MTLSESCNFFSLLQLEALQTVNLKLYIFCITVMIMKLLILVIR